MGSKVSGSPAEHRRDPVPGFRFPNEGEGNVDQKVRYLDSLVHNNVEIKICYSIFIRAEMARPTTKGTTGAKPRQRQDLVSMEHFGFAGCRFVESIFWVIAKCKLKRIKPLEYLSSSIESIRLKLPAPALVPG